MLRAVLRPGGKRSHVRRPFMLVLDPVVLPEPEPEPTTVTPGEGMSAGCLAHAAGSSQRGRAPVSAGHSGGGWVTPMEGVPERLVLTARARVLPPTVSRSRGRIILTPAGYTPLEGIPERLHLLTAQRVALAGRSAIISNGTPGGSGSVDSPVDGLVQEGVRRSSAGGQPVPADEFAFAPTAEEADGSGDVADVLEEAGAGPSPSGRTLSAGGFPSLDDGAFSPSRQLAEVCVQTGLSLNSRQPEGEGGEPEPVLAAKAAPEAAAEKGAGADAAAEPRPPHLTALPLDDDDDYGDAGGYDDGWLEEPGGAPDAPTAWHQEERPEQQQPAMQPGPASEADTQRKQRRVTRDPGVRLRNELGKRKSLAARPDMGMHEVAPGLRRSTRQREPPLKWWLNESKVFAREHT